MDEEELQKSFDKLEVNDQNKKVQKVLNVKNILAQINALHESAKEDAAGSSAQTYADPKSAERAKYFRNLGVSVFKAERNHEKAIAFLSQSLAAAPEDSDEMFQAYNERSFIHFQLRDYECCVLDVNRALQGDGCSKTLSVKLRERKRKCIVEYRKDTNCSIQGGATDPEELIDPELKPDTSWYTAPTYPAGPSPLLPDTSSKIELVPLKRSHEERWSSSIRATQDIGPGEILSTEEHYAMTIDFDIRFQHCAYCLKRSDTLIPCLTCTQTMYCSKKCRSNAYDSYHRTECKMIKFYERDRADEIEPLVMQAFLRGTGQGKEIPALMEKLKPDDIFQTSDGYNFETPFKGDYIDLLGIFEAVLRDFKEGSQVEEALPTVAEIIAVLQGLSFFPQSDKAGPSNGLNEMEQFTALLLLNNLLMLEITHYEVFEKVPAEPNTLDIFNERIIGRSVSLLLSFINTSCNPNTNIIIKDRRRILFSTRPIKAGEPLFFAFRHLFAVDNKEWRDSRSPRKEFKCECEACLNDWPSIPELTELEIRFLKHGKKELLHVLETCARDIKKGRAIEKLQAYEIRHLIVEHVKLLCEYVDITPSYDLLLCEEMLIRSLKTSWSDFHLSDWESYIAFVKGTISLLMVRIRAQRM